MFTLIDAAFAIIDVTPRCCFRRFRFRVRVDIFRHAYAACFSPCFFMLRFSFFDATAA